MIELSLKASLPDILNFIDNRLISILDQKKLGKLVKCPLILKRRYRDKIISDINGKILYVERTSAQASFIMLATIVTLAYRGFSNRAPFSGYGVQLQSTTENETRMLIDDIRHASKNGILPPISPSNRFRLLKKIFKILFTIIIALMIIVSAILTLGLSLLVILLIYIVARYKNWRIHQFQTEVMESIVDLFSMEFNGVVANPNRKPLSRGRRIIRAILDEIADIIDPSTNYNTE